MPEPPLNVEYWSSLYRVYEEDNTQYEEAIQAPMLVDKARQLCQWKDLSRSISFERMAPVLSDIDISQYVDKRPEIAVDAFLTHLQEKGVIKGDGLVTPAFLLHLATSGPTGSSKTFPIYDRRVWNAYVYLWRLRTEGERLYRSASTSPDLYGDFCRDFAASCPDERPRQYEQALFMFGGYIMDLEAGDSPTEISTIDQILSNQEIAIRDITDYSLVHIDRVRDSGR